MKIIIRKNDTPKNVDKINKLLETKKVFVAVFMDGCGHCINFKPEWDKFKQTVKKMSSDSIIFETKSNLIEHFPKIREKANGFPALLYFNQNEFKDFNQETNYERTVNSLLKFFKQNGMLSRQLMGGKSKKKKTKQKRKIKRRRETKRRRLS